VIALKEHTHTLYLNSGYDSTCVKTHTDLAALVVDPAYVVDPVYPSQWVQEVLKLAQDPGVPQYVVIVLVVEAVVGVVVG